MSEAATSLLQQALNLNPDERYEMAQQLLDSLDDADDLLPDDPAWRAELDRRLEEVEKHPERLLDGKTVMAEIRERQQRKKAQ